MTASNQIIVVDDTEDSITLWSIPRLANASDIDSAMRKSGLPTFRWQGLNIIPAFAREQKDD